MTASNLYRLAECLESGFMTPADMKAWAQDVRAHANTVKRTVLVEPQRGSQRRVVIHSRDAGASR